MLSWCQYIRSSILSICWRIFTNPGRDGWNTKEGRLNHSRYHIIIQMLKHPISLFRLLTVSSSQKSMLSCSKSWSRQICHKLCKLSSTSNTLNPLVQILRCFLWRHDHSIERVQSSCVPPPLSKRLDKRQRSVSSKSSISNLMSSWSCLSMTGRYNALWNW